MQPNYLAIFIFVYIRKKTPLFGEETSLSHFWTFIFVQKGKTNGLLENTTFFHLYILLILLLKENSIPVPYSQFSFFSEENYNKN